MPIKKQVLSLRKDRKRTFVSMESWQQDGRTEHFVAAALQAKLQTKYLGRNLILREMVGSTQDELKRLAEKGAPEGTIVLAEQQKKGRGQFGRQWISPAGKGIWMSLLLKPYLPLSRMPQLPLLVGVALIQSLKKWLPNLHFALKWPNDLLSNGKKISGILIETAAEDNRFKDVIVGIGISVNLQTNDYPEELRTKATSLRMLVGQPLDRLALVALFLEELELLYFLFLKQGFTPIRALWETYSLSLHKEIKLDIAGKESNAIPIGLDERGGLIVRLADSSLKTIYSANVCL